MEFSASITCACALQTVRTTYERTYLRLQHSVSALRCQDKNCRLAAKKTIADWALTYWVTLSSNMVFCSGPWTLYSVWMRDLGTSALTTLTHPSPELTHIQVSVHSQAIPRCWSGNESAPCWFDLPCSPHPVVTVAPPSGDCCPTLWWILPAWLSAGSGCLVQQERSRCHHDIVIMLHNSILVHIRADAQTT